MELFATIAAQIEAMRLPLYAVSLTAVREAHTPVLLFLHWHGFAPRDAAGRRGAVPGSALQLNEPWQRLEDLDAAVLDAGWRLGAWDVERDERRACTWVGASAREALECRQAFGAVGEEGGEALFVAEAPDRDALMAFGAAHGYVRWAFRPVAGGLWRDTASDDTLAPDGSRSPPCPVAPKAVVGLVPGRKAARTVYRLGRVTRLLVVSR